MFGNTLVLPLSSGNATLVKINQDGYASEYLLKRTNDELTVRIRHSKTKATADKPAMDRHNVEVVQTVYATDTVAQFTRKAYYVVEQLPSDTSVELMDALADWSIATANANLISLLGWES